MSDQFEMRINTRYQDQKWLTGEGVARGIRVEAPALMAAVTRAAEPGLQALQTNVNQIPARTGRLQRSPILKQRLYGSGNYIGGLTAMAVVGYQSDVAPHAYYVEYGARRSRRGTMPTFAPLARAFESARPAMEQALSRELQNVAERSVSGGG